MRFSRGWRVTWRWLLGALGAWLLFLALGMLIPRHTDFRSAPDGIPIYVTSNGFHTDLVLPLREARTGTDWSQRLPGDSAQWARFEGYKYVAFGWGSEAFYLESYGGHFPQASTVVRALLPGRTLMHVDFYQRAPVVGPRVARVQVTPAQYQTLVQHVSESFAPDPTGRWVLRNAAGYTPEDFFFRATGSYHGFRTCNDWTNQGLQRAGIRAALKAPLAAGVLYQVRQAR
jgi:uncharacterized protein (TIGR02117 family)